MPHSYAACDARVVQVLNIFIFIIETGYDKAKNVADSTSDSAVFRLDHERLKFILDAADEHSDARLGTIVEGGAAANDGDDAPLLDLGAAVVGDPSPFVHKHAPGGAHDTSFLHQGGNTSQPSAAEWEARVAAAIQRVLREAGPRPEQTAAPPVVAVSAAEAL